MKIVSFNINGLRARPHQLSAIIEKHQPDVIGLQETKVADEQFPQAEIEALGYHVHYHGQKGHYGVALLSRQAPLEVHKGFPSDGEESQKRFIWGRFADANGQPVTVMNGYFPQGESRAHPVKFPAKTKFYADLQALLEQRFSPDESLALMGDFNISPQDCDIGIGEVNAKRWLRTGKCTSCRRSASGWSGSKAGACRTASAPSIRRWSIASAGSIIAAVASRTSRVAACASTTSSPPMRYMNG